MSKKYPKTLYVQTFEVNNSKEDEENLSIWKNPENLDNGKVAVYEFKKFVKKQTKIILE